MSRQTTPKVELLAHTGGELIAALAAKLCYSNASIDDLLDKVSTEEQDGFLSKISQLGHLSVFEHITFSFGIEGVSRVLTHQLVRHRVASYSQKSQRYVAHKGGFDYVVPPSVEANPAAKAIFDDMMTTLADTYDKLLQEGASPEDARYILPNACETKIIVTMNARELIHFFKLRCCQRAQAEIRTLAEMMLKAVLPIAPIIFAKAGPACISGACAEGKMTCGKIAEVREHFASLK
ncbi:MAG: FAD-dependent thymidylate synthase [Deferribacteraceae bacterium]|jgi:thymidylate synthase (FAD)|nr:FAD-dependent thymidylate synthase [Deferribacteraceae bacterium]